MQAMSKLKRALLGIGAGLAVMAFAVVMSALQNYLNGSVAGKLLQLFLAVLLVVGIGVSTYRSLDDKDAP